jgi:hypothetical protein
LWRLRHSKPSICAATLVLTLALVGAKPVMGLT